MQLNQEFFKHKERLEGLLKIAITYQDETKLSDNLRERLQGIAAYVLQFALRVGGELTPASALEDIACAVQAKLNRGLPSRVLQSNNDIIGEVKDLVSKMMSLIDVFEVRLSDKLF